jgi:hypothetical protein
MINHHDVNPRPQPPEGPDPRRHFGPYSPPPFPTTGPTYPGGGGQGPLPV